MAKSTLENLDLGMLDAMWDMLKLGGIKPSKADLEALIEHTDFVRQALIQKTAGQRKDDPKGYINFNELPLHINMIVLCALSLRVSGMLEKFESLFDDEEAQNEQKEENENESTK